MADSLIIDSIGFWYKNGRRLIDNFSATLQPGNLFLIQGENGSGKSTFLKILSTLFLPRAGSIRLAEVEFSKTPSKIRPWLGYSSGPQPGFYPILNGIQNLKFFYGIKIRESVFPLEQVESLAEEFQLPLSSLERPFREYSTGMRQKLGLIRAFIGAPKLVLLDEPFSCLDTPSEKSLLRFLQNFRESKKGIVVLATPKFEQLAQFEKPPEVIHMMKNPLEAPR